MSIEEKVEEHYKKILDGLHIRHYGKTEKINSAITDALKNASSKSGNSGNNYPDIQLLLENANSRRIPVMIEAKGTKGRLEKLTKAGDIEQETVWTKDSKERAKNPHKAGDLNYASIQNYAVNGALHYRKIFSIKDGGKIKMVFPDGLAVTLACRYIDDIHIQVGINVFDKFEFARVCKEDGATIVPVED